MKPPRTIDVLENILRRDDRYKHEAYLFVHEALSYTVSELDFPRHVSGPELLDGIRAFALSQFGPMTQCVLNEWGINECLDFGHIVFNLINEGLLGKTDQDTLEDFAGGYDFNDAFLKPFRPTRPIVREPCNAG